MHYAYFILNNEYNIFYFNIIFSLKTMVYTRGSQTSFSWYSENIHVGDNKLTV